MTTSVAPREDRKQLESTRRASAFQKARFAELRTHVERGLPYALVSGPVPHEILAALGIPYMVDVWWSSLVAAKRLSGRYNTLLEKAGYHRDLPRYGAMSLASVLDTDNADPPWGGLPRPAIAIGRFNTASAARTWELTAQAFDTPLFMLEVPGSTRMYPRWFDLAPWHWEDLYESHRIDFMVEQFRPLIAQLEQIAGKKLDLDVLRTIMQRVNRQAEYLDEVRTMVRTAPRTPVRMTEQMTTATTMQWHRDSPWAVEQGEFFRDEVKARFDAGVAACPEETHRLMWIGWGLWSNTDFYLSFERSHQAVFVRSMYLDLAIDSYIRYGLKDPLRALASRYVSLSEELHTAPWCSEWAVQEAGRYRIDGAVVMMSEAGQGAAGGGSRFTVRALERAGIPTLGVDVDPVSPFVAEDLQRQVAAFIETRVAPRSK